MQKAVKLNVLKVLGKKFWDKLFYAKIIDKNLFFCGLGWSPNLFVKKNRELYEIEI